MNNPLTPTSTVASTTTPVLSTVTPTKTSTPIKIEDIKKTTKDTSKPPSPEADKNKPDDRLRWLFRAKISGVAGAKTDASIAPAEATWKIKTDTKLQGLANQINQLPDPKNTDVLKLAEEIKNAIKTSNDSVIPTPSSFATISSGEKSLADKIDKLTKLPDKTEAAKALQDEIAKLMAVNKEEKKDAKAPESGELIIDSTKGDILGTPFIRAATYQKGTAKFKINDPDDSLRTQILEHSKIEIEVGFVNGFIINKFIGVIFSVTRSFPDGTEVEVVDLSQKMATEAPAVHTPGAIEQPLVDDKTGERVTTTFEGEAVFMGGGVGLTATHATLPLTSRVRLTNTANNKTAIVTINDKSVNPGGWVLELSKDSAKALGLNETGSIRVKAEVLETELEKKAREKNVKPQEASDVKKTDKKPLAPSATRETENQRQETKPEQPKTPTSNAASSDMETAMAKISDRETKIQIINAEVFTKATDLKFNDKSPLKLEGAGSVSMSQLMLEVAQKEAVLKGGTLIARGNTISASAPGKGESSGVILDYQQNRAAFIHASIKRRTGVQLEGGYGAITVKGFNVNDKTVVSATAVSTQPPKQHPTGIIQIPEWGKINLNEPIIPGSPYTWGIATRNGERVPTKEIMGNIIKIAKVITPLTEKTVGAGKSWGITSWYRDPATNAATPNAATNSQHLTGGAVDFYYDTNGGEMALYREIKDSYDGGLAIKEGCFLHIDIGPKRFWYY